MDPGPEEWQELDIPENFRPLPLLRVSAVCFLGQVCHECCPALRLTRQPAFNLNPFCSPALETIHCSPLLQVRNLPEGATEADVQGALEAVGLTIRSCVFDPAESTDAGSNVALVGAWPLPSLS